MTKFCQFLAELFALDIIVAGYYRFTFFIFLLDADFQQVPLVQIS